jgi:hypothetical protein
VFFVAAPFHDTRDYEQLSIYELMFENKPFRAMET